MDSCLSKNEIWKPIPGYEGLYDASNMGRIRSHPGRITKDWRGGVRHWKTFSVLRPKHHSTRGDYKLTLRKDSTTKDYLVARLVAMTWLGVPSDQNMTVNHINGNYLDNRVENLEWLSRGDNLRHGFKSGLFSMCNTTFIVDGDGKTKTFYCMSEASRYLGWSNGYLKRRKALGFTDCRSKIDGKEYKFYVAGGDYGTT